MDAKLEQKNAILFGEFVPASTQPLRGTLAQNKSRFKEKKVDPQVQKLKEKQLEGSQPKYMHEHNKFNSFLKQKKD